jgi:hypothetical protein
MDDDPGQLLPGRQQHYASSGGPASEDGGEVPSLVRERAGGHGSFAVRAGHAPPAIGTSLERLVITLSADSA